MTLAERYLALAWHYHAAGRADLAGLDLEREARMAQPILMPGYDRTAWFADDYPQSLVTPEKVVLHSTEGGTLPSYSGGASAPQVTLDPWRRRRYQHFPLNMPARALLNPASTPVSENRDGAVQIEIIGYSDGNYAVKHGNAEYDLDRLTDDDYDWLGQEIAAICEATGIRPVLTKKPWIEYPASWGLHTPARMSSAEYDSFRGICAHKHVSGNDHGDPDLDPDRLQSSIDRHSGNADPKVLAEQKAINAAMRGTPGYKPIPEDGQPGPLTTKAKEAYMTTLADIDAKLDKVLAYARDAGTRKASHLTIEILQDLRKRLPGEHADIDAKLDALAAQVAADDEQAKPEDVTA